MWYRQVVHELSEHIGETLQSDSINIPHSLRKRGRPCLVGFQSTVGDDRALGGVNIENTSFQYGCQMP